MRLDQKVVELVPELSRASAAKLIAAGKVEVNGAKATKASLSTIGSDKISVDYTPSLPPIIDLPVIYEDNDCVVINKPVGVLAHSKGAFNPEATVASWLAAHRTRLDLEQIKRSEQPELGLTLSNREGIVHRLDRATSGVMICAKNEKARKFLQTQFSTRRVKKTYVAVISGTIDPPEAIIDMPIERNPRAPATFRVGARGKAAQTHYTVIDTDGVNSLVELKPTTGRTHQLRVHLKQLGHPIIGDTLYGGEANARLMLHASELEITLPSGERKVFRSKTPPEFGKLVK